LLLSLTIPIMQGEVSHLAGLIWSLIGAITGYGLLWIVVELGKIAFGKKAFRLSAPASFSWIRRAATDPADGEGSDADLVVGDESWKSLPPPTFLERLKELFGGKKSDRGESWIWSERFGRESDRLIIKCTEVAIDGESLGQVELVFTLEELKVGDRTWKLEKVDIIKGLATVVIVPREAMGFGDVKFMACIGAFLGWKAVLFSIMAGSCVGAVVGILGIVSGRRDWSGRIPFGPYLALGSLLWFFSGPAIVNWYWSFATGPK
jgi:leader peptidase (prepilin peptidase)/N-methyltransferase